MSRTISPYSFYSLQNMSFSNYMNLYVLKSKLSVIDDFDEKMNFVKETYGIKDRICDTEIYLNDGKYLRILLLDSEYHIMEFNVGDKENMNDYVYDEKHSHIDLLLVSGE